MSADDESVRDQFKGLLALQEKGSSDSCRCRNPREGACFLHLLEYLIPHGR